MIVHHNADNSLTTGGDTAAAPFEGKHKHHEHHEHKSGDAPAAASSAASPAAPAPSTAASAASATAKTNLAPSPTPSATSSSGRKKKSPEPDQDAPSSTAAAASVGKASRKKKPVSFADGESTAATQTKGSKKKGAEGTEKKTSKKRKAGESDAASSDAPTGASTGPIDPSAAVPTPMLGRRRKNFEPVSAQDAMDAFQRTLAAAREAAGLQDAPETGAFAPRNRSKTAQAQAAQAAEEQQLALEIEEAQAEAAQERAQRRGIVNNNDDDEDDGEDEDGSEGEEEEDDDDFEDSDEDGEGRGSKRRKTGSSKKKAVGGSERGAAASGKKKLSKAAIARKKAGKKANRLSTTAQRNALIQEHAGKEFFVTLKGKAYLHAKWVDIYAFLQPPKARLIEAKEEDQEKTSGVFTQLRIKLQRFMRQTPLPIGDDEELFLSDFVEIDRILARKTEETSDTDSDEETKTDANTAAASSTAVTPSKRGGSKPRTATYFLVKWMGLPYSAATWEHQRYVRDDEKIHEFEARQKNPTKKGAVARDERQPVLGASNPSPRPSMEAWQAAKMVYPDRMPTFKSGNELRPWQVESLTGSTTIGTRRKGAFWQVSLERANTCVCTSLSFFPI